MAGFLHPEGIYDDPKGGQLRAAVYPRLRAHFQFQNELNLFVEVDHHAKFSSNIYSASPSTVGFEHISNLYAPQTIDACFEHSGSGDIPGLKDEIESEGKLKVVWNTSGHRSRLISIATHELELFARLYDSEGTPARQARLPALHAKQLVAVLEKFANQPNRLGDLQGSIFQRLCSMKHMLRGMGQFYGRLNSLKIHHNGYCLALISLLGRRSTRLRAKTVRLTAIMTARTC